MASKVPAATVAKAVRASSEYLKFGEGASKDFPFLRSLGISMTLGIGMGMMWKTWHWNEKRYIAQYYADLAKREAREESARIAMIKEKFAALEEELLA